MRNVKRLLQLICVIGCVLAFSACSSDSSENGQKDTTQRAETTQPADTTQSCETASSCDACLDIEGCNWTGGVCRTECLMDVSCYGPDNESASTCPGSADVSEGGETSNSADSSGS